MKLIEWFWGVKSIGCGYSFELHRQVNAIQMGTHNICLYKRVDNKYTDCNPKTMELIDCALIGACALIRSNTVFFLSHMKNSYEKIGLNLDFFFA